METLERRGSWRQFGKDSHKVKNSQQIQGISITYFQGDLEGNIDCRKPNTLTVKTSKHE